MYVWFDHPTTRPDGSIAVIPGQPLQFGTFAGNSVQPRITRVRRMPLDDDDGTAVQDETALINGEPTNTVEVTWEYDTQGNATGTPYNHGGTPEVTVSGAGSDPTFAAGDEDDASSAGTAGTYKRMGTFTIQDDDLERYGEITVTVSHMATARDETSAEAVESEGAKVAAVETNVRSVAVTRSGDVVKATWRATGSPGLEQRIVLFIQTGATVNDREWAVIPSEGANNVTVGRNTTTTGSTWGQWNIGSAGYNLAAEVGEDVTWPDDDDGSNHDITTAKLKGATMLRVDSRADGGDWVKSDPKTIP
jgi:hypothetical protein